LADDGRVRRVLAPVLLLLALLPAPAHASCAALPRPYDEFAQVVFVGRALDGPATPSGELLSPARFAVIAYEKGGGPAERVVGTAVEAAPVPGVFGVSSEGISPSAGQVWRIYANEGDVLATSICSGSRPVAENPPAPYLAVGASRFTPVPSTFAGDAPKLPRARVRGRRRTLHTTVPLVSVRVMVRGRVLSRGVRLDDTRWRIAVPHGTTRLVVDTGDRAYAGALSRLSQR
jgi:hypothetical protein